MTFADLYAGAQIGLLVFIACLLIRIAVAVENRRDRDHEEW